MRSINIKVLRTFKNNFSLFSGSVLLSLLIAVFVTSCLSVGSVITDTVQRIMDDMEIEHSEFVLAGEMDDIKEAEDKFNVVIESCEYHDFEKGDKTIRVFRENSHINKPYITDGTAPDSKTDIMINRDYAKNNDLSIGDEVTIEDKKYTICGFYLRPDYMYMLKNFTEPYPDKANFGIAMLSEESFDEAFPEHMRIYSAKFKDGKPENDKTIEFRKYLNDNYKILSYVSADSNIRITTANSLGGGVTRMVYTYSPVIYILIMGFLVITLTRVMKRERRNIGIMLSFGYTKREIAASYVKLVCIVSLSGSIIGVILGVLVTPFLTDFYSMDLIMPNMDYRTEPKGIIMAVAIPLILMSLAAYLYISKALKNDAVMLLRNSYSKKQSSRGRRMFSKTDLSNSFKYNIRLILRNKLRYFVFFAGNLIASCLILMGVIIGFTINHVLDEQEKYVNSYGYSYRMKNVDYEYDGEGEAVLTMALETKDTGGSIAVTGIKDDSKYLSFDMKEGGKADITDGFYISYCASVFYNISCGDTITLISPASLDEYSVKIDGVLDINKERAIYCSIDKAAELFGYDKGAYDMVISDDPLDFDEDVLSSTVKSADIVSTLEKLFKPLMQTIYVIIVLGVIMGVVVILMISRLTTDENTSNMTMLKIFGYTRREIGKMIFGLNKWFAIIAYAASLPLMMLMCKMMCISEIENYGLYMNVYFPWYYMLITGVAFFAVFMIAQLAAYKRINNVSTVSEQRE